jgi:hypothetical protein
MSFGWNSEDDDFDEDERIILSTTHPIKVGRV